MFSQLCFHKYKIFILKQEISDLIGYRKKNHSEMSWDD